MTEILRGLVVTLGLLEILFAIAVWDDSREASRLSRGWDILLAIVLFVVGSTLVVLGVTL